MKTGISSLLIISLITLVVLSCGDDPSGPSGSDLTPSVLSLAFTGDSSKIGSDSDQNEALLFSTTGPKGSCEVTASWTICDQSEFASYTLYRSENPDISENISSATVLGVFSDPNISDYVDDDVSWAKAYFYALKTVDGDENSVWSNEASITTPGALTPSVLSLAFTGDSSKIGSDSDHNEALRFSNIGSKGACEVTASWTICDQSEFASYTLYRSENPDISTDPSAAIVLGVFNDPNISEYVDDDVSWVKQYYYAVKLTDDDNNSVWSNEPTIITPGAPTPSVLSVGDLFSSWVELQWSQCPDSDFDSYKLFRSDFPNIHADTSAAICIATLSQASDTSFADTGVAPEQTYYYALMTSDTDDFFSWSNELEVIIPEYPEIPDSVVATVSVGSKPEVICSLPSGEYVYVANGYDDNISVIRTSDNTVVATVNVGVYPNGICSLSSGEYVYVTNWSDDNISIIRTSDNTVVAMVSVGVNPSAICSLPSGEYVYVTNWSDDNVSVIRTSDNTVVATVSVGDSPYGICSLPSGEYVYVTNLSDDNVSVIRTSDNTVVATVSVGDGPFGICSLPSGEYVYVTNRSDDTISVIRTSDNTVVATVSVGDGPNGICSLPSGEYVYVTNLSDDNISVIRTSDNTVVAMVSVGVYPSAICSLPSGEYVYVTNWSDDNISVLH